MSAPKTYKSEAIVLKHFDLGEADRILTLYTANQGKVRAVARGARRTTSRLGGHVEPLTHCTLMISRGRELDRVTQSQTIESFISIKSSLGLTAQALYFIELVDAFTSERIENYLLYRLLLETLHHLGSAPSVAILSRYFELGFLKHLGYQPQLHDCVNCHCPLQPTTNYFSAAGGGMLCPRCANVESVVVAVSVNALKVFRLLGRGDYASASRLNLNPDLAAEMARVTQCHIRYLLERDLRSGRFLDRLKSEAIWDCPL